MLQLKGNFDYILSVFFSYLPLVTHLLADPRVDLTEDNFCLVWASAYGHLEVVKSLLADPRISDYVDRHEEGPNGEEDITESIFFEAVTGGHLDIVRFLLDDPRFNHAIDGSLVTVAKAGNLEILKLLLGNARVLETVNLWRPEAISESKGDVRRFLENHADNLKF